MSATARICDLPLGLFYVRRKLGRCGIAMLDLCEGHGMDHH
ncbi:MAG: hypothetical protein WA459_18030 [Stellaceae bacterium]